MYTFQIKYIDGYALDCSIYKTIEYTHVLAINKCI